MCIRVVHLIKEHFEFINIEDIEFCRVSFTYLFNLMIVNVYVNDEKHFPKYISYIHILYTHIFNVLYFYDQ